jgi:hypothetical protein
MQGRFKLDTLGVVNRIGSGGLIIFRGPYLDNTGRTLALDETAGDYFISGIPFPGGEVTRLVGGRVTQSPGGALRYGDKTVLSGVLVEGDLELSSTLPDPRRGEETPVLHLRDGTAFTGRANLAVPGAQLLIEQDMASQNRFDLSGSGARVAPGLGKQLLLDTDAVVTLSGNEAMLGSGLDSGADTVINRGRIHARAASGLARIDAATFSNLGTVEVTDGSLAIDSAGLQNIVDGVLTGGTWRVADATLSIDGGSGPVQVAINRADVVLAGAMARFDSIDSLSINDAGGSFRLVNRDFSAGGSFTNRGLLHIKGSTFSASGLTNEGNLAGHGLIVSDVMNGGVLAPEGELRFAGLLALDPSSIIEIELEGGTRFDRLYVDGDVTLGGALAVGRVEDSSTQIGPDDVFTILKATGAISGVFENIGSGARIEVGSGTMLVDISADSITLSAFQADEPSALSWLGIGLAELVVRRRRQENRSRV